MEPAIGTWWKVKAGPQRGQEGVIDFIRDFPAGRFFRLTNPDTKTVVGRFKAEQIEPTTAPRYESRVSEATRQQAMNLLTGGRVKA